MVSTYAARICYYPHIISFITELIVSPSKLTANGQPIFAHSLTEGVVILTRPIASDDVEGTGDRFRHRLAAL